MHGGPVRHLRHMLWLLPLMLTSSQPQLLAHHSISAFADPSKLVSMTGKLTRVEWVNPHVIIYIDVEATGQPQTWKFQSAAPAWWRSAGIGKADFAKHMGETVTVSANVARDGSAYGYFQ